MDELYSLKSGRTLVANPYMLDPIFLRSVIFLTEYGVAGAMGFIVNKPTELKIHEVFNNFPHFDSNIYYGGPVDQDIVYYIHNLGLKIKGSVPITKNLWLGGDISEVKKLILAKDINVNQIRFFIGYSGWAENQLEEELQNESWVVGPMKQSYLLRANPSNIWQTVLKASKSKKSFLANYAFSPSLN